MKAPFLVVRLAVVAAALGVAGCNSTPAYYVGPNAPAENADAICARQFGRGTDGYYACYPKQVAAHPVCDIGSGMDAIVSIQKGKAKCPDGGTPYAAARNNPAGYSTVISERK